MKAVSFAAPRQVHVIDVPEPTMGPDDVLLDIHYVGLCGSDLNTYRGSFTLVSYPLIPGHEVSGVIAARGDSVPPTLQVGDRVTVSPYTNCGICPSCRAGRPNCCQYNETLGVQRNGALSQRFALPYTKVHKSSVLSMRELALVEPMSVGYHAANRGQVSEMDTVLVIGCGTIGIGAIAAAVRKGASVLAVDVDDGKLDMASRFGAQHVANSTRQDIPLVVGELTGQEGVSVAIEAVGLPETYRLAVEAVAYAGRIVYIGYAKAQVCYDTTDFVRKELDIRGSRNALRVFPAVIRMIEQREQPFETLVSRVYPYTAAHQALHDWDQSPGEFTKILIDMTD
jgi:threonine dehydrogenase-like Zn-dependent dehydrogenase